MAKFVRIIKIMRLVRLIKLIKVAQNRDRISGVILSQSSLSSAVERLLLAVFGFFIGCHVLACMWIIQANLQKNQDESWIAQLP